MVTIAGPEEPFGATEQTAMVLMPADAATGAERLLDPWRGAECRFGNLEEAGEKRRAAFLGEHHRLLRLEAEHVGVGIIRDVIGRRLGREPFTDVAFRGASASGERRGSHGATVGECLVQPQPVTHDHKCRTQRGSHVAEHAPEKAVQPRFIDFCLRRHRRFPPTFGA